MDESTNAIGLMIGNGSGKGGSHGRTTRFPAVAAPVAASGAAIDAGGSRSMPDQAVDQ